MGPKFSQKVSAGEIVYQKIRKARGNHMVMASKSSIVEKHAQHGKDTGSSNVQIALLTERINHLTEHFKTHKKDHHSRRGLLKLVARRRNLLRYMHRTNFQGYKQLIADLGLRK